MLHIDQIAIQLHVLLPPDLHRRIRRSGLRNSARWEGQSRVELKRLQRNGTDGLGREFRRGGGGAGMNYFLDGWVGWLFPGGGERG